MKKIVGEQRPEPPVQKGDTHAYALVDTGAIVPMGGIPELQHLHMVGQLADEESGCISVDASIEKAAKQMSREKLTFLVVVRVASRPCTAQLAQGHVHAQPLARGHVRAV